MARITTRRLTFGRRGAVLVGLLAGLTALVTWVPSSSGAPAKVRNGHYVGVGDGQLRVSFHVRQRTAEDFYRTFTYPLDDLTPCSTAGTLNGVADGIDNGGRFRLDEAVSTTVETVKGRFRGPARVTGRIAYTQTNVALCPGDYELVYEARRYGNAPAAAKPVPARHRAVSPRNGEYAGGSGKAAVWFDVVGGLVRNGRVNGVFPNCDDSFPVVNTDDEPDGKGRFEIERTDGAETVVIKGRFTANDRVKGKVLWTQNNNCPAGEYEFGYNARRFGPIG
jgi:hypothetical protein